MKECFKCGHLRPLEEYYKHSGMAGGYLNKCKPCAKKDTLRNRLKKIEYYRAYDKERMNTPERIAARERFANSEDGKNSHMLAKIRWAAKNPEKRQESQKKWRLKNKEKVAAQNKVGAAIRKGTLIKKPCVECNNKKSQAHHPDYNKPLDVIWLCASCHKKEHARAE